MKKPLDVNFLRSFHLSACLAYNPKTVSQWKTKNASFFELDFYRYASAISTPCLSAANVHYSLFPKHSFKSCFTFRLVDIKITFQLKGINLQTVRYRELPDCYYFNVKVQFGHILSQTKMCYFIISPHSIWVIRGLLFFFHGFTNLLYWSLDNIWQQVP